MLNCGRQRNLVGAEHDFGPAQTLLFTLFDQRGGYLLEREAIPADRHEGTFPLVQVCADDPALP